MVLDLSQFAADHRYVLELAARRAGFSDPVAVDPDVFGGALIEGAQREEPQLIDGVMIRDWSPDGRRSSTGVQLGMRLYQRDGVHFVLVRIPYVDSLNHYACNFLVVDRTDYRRLYRIALRCRKHSEPPALPPVLPRDQQDILWKNTIGYLDRYNLALVKRYGGRAKRGILLTGTPGNGKTMACRWIWEECRQRNWEWRLVTPDAYRAARTACNPVQAVRELFNVDRRGIVFFDDMDIALRDRDTVQETDDQAVFLGALDGLTVAEGVVFVFTTNCALNLIDKAFKRPGRLDVVLHFTAPDEGLRRELMNRWHADIRAQLDVDEAVRSTEGYSFAEVEELKNLLIMHFMDTMTWDWSWAVKQFAINREDFAAEQRQRMGFGGLATNGKLHPHPEALPF